MSVDARQAHEYIKKLEKGGKKCKDVLRSFVNNMAVASQEKAKRNIQKTFKFKNPSSKKFMESGVYFQKAKTGDVVIKSEVGAVGNPRSLERKQRRSEMLARQELGGQVSQLKSSGKRLRKRLIAPDPRNNKNKFSPRLSGRVAVVKKGTKETKPGRIHAQIIRHARINHMTYALTPFGVYRVLGTSGKRKKIVRIQTFRGSIKTPQSPWLAPAVEEVKRNREKYFLEAYNFRMSKALGGKK